MKNRNNHCRFNLRWLVTSLAVTVMASLPAFAATGTWLNSSTVHIGNWSDSTKWQSGVIPDAAGDIANFNIDYGTANKTNTIDGTSRTVGTLNIGDPGVTYRSVTIQASGGASLICDNAGSGALLAKAANANNVVDAITAPVILADNLTVNNANTTSGNEIKMQGVISETGGARSITRVGGGVLTLGNYSGTVISPVNTFSGGFNLNAGEVQLSGGAVFGTGILTINGGTLTARGGSRTPTNSVVAGGDFTLGGANGGGNLMSLGGPVDLGGSTRVINVDATGGAAISGTVSNGGLTKSGLRTLTLSGASTYSGGTTIAAGTLLVNNTSGSGTGTGQVLVNDSSTLVGNGIIAGPVVVASNGTIGAGDASASVGTLTINNSLTLQGGANFRISKTGNVRTNDQIVGISTSNYGGILTITNVTTDATSLSAGDTFTLFSAASHLGNFSSIVDANASGTVFSFANGVLTVLSVNTNNQNGVVVDPGVQLTNYTSLGEWSTNGNFDNWTTTNVSSAAVSGGTLSGTANGNNPQVKLTGFFGPDLDLAFNDYLDVRLQVPTNFSGSIQFYFGATNNYYGTTGTTTGFSPLRYATITSPPTDGAFHIYRIFFGPNVYWRGNLSDVRIDPLGTGATNGQSFALDYVRVGDLAGDIYVARSGVDVPAAASADPVYGQPVQEMDSKHFRFCWNNWSVTNFPSIWSTNWSHGTLRNFEEVWKSHVWRLGFPEPSHPVGSTLPYTGTKYKLNVTTWNGGYWTGVDDNGIAWINITPDGLIMDPPTWVPPHEFTHACQESANVNGGQTVDGQFWENNANYGREQWLHFYPWWSGQSGLDPYFADTSQFWLAHGRNYYLCWPFWLYLDENPDNLPGLGSSYGSFFTVSLWKYAQSSEYLWDTLHRLATATSVQDIFGYVARRDVVWDYSTRAAMQAAAATGDTEFNQRNTYAELRQRPDDPSWWQVPLEFAPQQGGYKIVQLIPQGSGAGRVVCVNFHGLPDSGGRADWRACLVVIATNGAVRYGNLWDAGTNSVTLATNENTVYLSVAGTPTNLLAETTDETQESFQSSPAKERFPFEIQVAGATPYETPAGSTSGLVQVANGGGWRASTATVDSTAYVGPNARVLGSAKVRGNARILDYAIVEGSAIVTNNAIISGHALVRDSAVVRDFAKVRDYGMVIDGSVVSGYARVLQHGEVTGGSTITNWATVKGSASTFNDGATTLPQGWNDAVLDGDFSTSQSCSNGFQFGFIEYNDGPLNWINNRTAPRRLYAAYEFNDAQPSLAKDLYGVTDGYLEGNPTWISYDGQRSGFVAFNGANQFVILDRSVSDLREITVTAWVKWSGGAANQSVWYFGTAPTNCMFFTPSDGAGNARFSITSGGTTQSLAWTNNPLPVGVWTHVAVTLSNSVTGALYINGNKVATGSITITPDQLDAPNVNTNPQQNYLARGAGNILPFFQGALDSVRIYTGALTDAEISAMQPPPTFAGTGTLYVDLRATNAASGSSSLFATWTNFGSTVGNFTKSGSPTYNTNVAGTGIPGIYFDGTSAHYASANMSIADITGAGDRTIEVWAYNPALATEETMVALGDRSGTRKDCAFNFGNASGWGAVTHFNDDVPWGAMGFPPTDGWHHLVYIYDGNVTVRIYVDAQLWFTDTLGGVLVTPTGEPIYIGCQNGIGQLFSGYINAVRVWGGVMTPDQVAANYLLGPWTLPAAQKAIIFAAISNYTMNVGATLTFTNSAKDPNQPPLPLAFSIVSAPTNAAINADTGLFTWRAPVSQANTTNLTTLRVSNNATPSLAATQSFVATINPVSTPAISNALLFNGTFGFQINGSAGPDYMIQVSTNLLDWSTLFSTNPAALPFTWTDPSSPSDPAQFYRVLLGP